MNYLQFDFETIDAHQSEQLLALLNLQGFEGFEEEGHCLKAFIPEVRFSESSFTEVIDFFENIVYTRTVIEPANWNKKWEESYEPVVVDDFAAIRADFHSPVPNVRHDIVITPKMSFGTGHHATTFLMIREMEQIDFSGKTVLDFGTGTGILAILAEKLGAGKIHAIDYDDWSISNAIENIEHNNCYKIILSKSDKIVESQQFDIVLANINLNVLVSQMEALAKVVSSGGQVLLSGILKENEEAIMEAIKKNGLLPEAVRQRGDWILLLAKHP